MTSLSEMRDKLDDFVTYEGCDLLAICSIPELRKGRKAGGNSGSTALSGRCGPREVLLFRESLEARLILRSLFQAVAF
jgi:hypothetical protein